MSGVRHAEHVVISTPGLDESIRFYADVIGMQVLKEENGTVFLGCGLDDSFDIGLRSGPLGVEHIAMRVGSIDEIQKKFDQARAPYRRAVRDEMGTTEVIEFSLPTGLRVELMNSREDDYLRPSRGRMERRQASAPLDLDHLTMLATDPKVVSDFLQSVMPLKVSEARDNGDGTWRSVFMRYGYHHHDFAFLSTKNDAWRLHHVALSYSSVGHMVLAIDKIAQAGIELESGPFRHVIGSNISVYYITPAGNRLELATEVATVSPTTPPKIWPPGPLPPTSAWGPSVYTEASRVGI